MRSAAASGENRDRVALLAAQAFTLGLTMAWLLVPASSIFLDAYGPGLLPVTYIGAAIAGAASTAGLTAALRRRAISTVAGHVLVGLVATLLASWAVLSWRDAAWVSFGLLVLVPILTPVGFLFLVGQAGALLDVRALKARYARVIAGFALGFVVGGLATSSLIRVLGSIQDLVAAAAASAGAFLALLTATRRRFPVELTAVREDDASGRPSLREALRDRFVVLLVAFQMLSAVESQWLDYLVFDRASQRYAGEELARFIGQYTAIAYGADILFLLLFAGWLLRRSGLRYGLTANPAAVLALLGAMVAATALQGSGATLVFVLVVGARVVDLTFADGAARTAMSAGYQAVPAATREVAQAGVEGLAVPVAIGLSGVGLLVLGATVGTSGLTLPLLTVGVVAAWAVVAVAAYRRYRVSLLDGLRHRELDTTALSFDEGTNDEIDRLLDSDDEADVRLALEILELATGPESSDRLRTFVADHRDAVRVDAIERLARVDPEAAAVAAGDCLDDPSPAVRAACVRILGVGGAAATTEIALLLRDSDPEVVRGGLAATSWPRDAALVGGVIRALSDRRTAGAAVDALVRGGSIALAAIDGALGDAGTERRVGELLARACRLQGGPAAVAVLERHMDHVDRDVGLAVMTALGALVAPGQVAGAAIDDDLQHAVRLLQAILELDGDPGCELVCLALRDELELVRHRVLAALASRQGAEAIGRVTFQLSQADPRAHALAIEWLDVTLTGGDRVAVALLEPHLSDVARLRLLARRMPASTTAADDLLVDLVTDPAAVWRRPWLRACALHAAWGRVEVDLDGLPDEGADDDGILRETLDALRGVRSSHADR